VRRELPVWPDLLQDDDIPASEELRLRAFGGQFAAHDGTGGLWPERLHVQNRDAERLDALGLLGPKRLDVSSAHSDVGLRRHQNSIFRVQVPDPGGCILVEHLRELIG